VLKEKPNTWVHGVSPPSRQRRLESLTNALHQLADSGLGVTSVIANFHHRWIIPLMERELRIFEMSDVANPVSLMRSQLMQEWLPKGYATTRARHVVNLNMVPHNDDDLWSFVMLLDAGPVSTASFRPLPLPSYLCLSDGSCLQAVNVHATRSDPPRPRSQAASRVAQQRERDQAALAKERRIRRQERLNQYNE
jgi:hypothetical protein